MNRKFIVSLVVILISLLGELLLWNQVLVFSLMLIVLAYIKHKIIPIKREFLWYLLLCLGGASIEVVLVNVGHGWSYIKPDVLGIPFWIPLFWGLMGTTVVVMYNGFIQQKST